MIISTGEVCKHMDTILKTYENGLYGIRLCICIPNGR